MIPNRADFFFSYPLLCITARVELRLTAQGFEPAQLGVLLVESDGSSSSSWWGFGENLSWAM
jgi:hypothetical protein